MGFIKILIITRRLTTRTDQTKCIPECCFSSNKKESHSYDSLLFL